MGKTITIREPDGSLHYGCCYPEGIPRHSGFARRPSLFRPTQHSPVLRRLRLFGAAFGVATAMFWATMLTSPPTSEARLEPAPLSASCTEAGRPAGVWFKTEMNRRAWSHTGRDHKFNLKLSQFNAAQAQCASGMTERSIKNFRAVEYMILAIDNRPMMDVDR